MQNEAPNPEIEDWVIQAFIDLGIDSIGPETDFFAGGGSSLTAIKLISKVDQEFGEYALPPVDLFERPTVAQIAVTIGANCAPERASA